MLCQKYKMYIGWNNIRHSLKGPRKYRQANYNCDRFKLVRHKGLHKSYD